MSLANHPVLADAIASMPARTRKAFTAHLHGGTSADWLADWLKRHGTPVSASTIRTYRRALNTEGM